MSSNMYSVKAVKHTTIENSKISLELDRIFLFATDALLNATKEKKVEQTQYVRQRRKILKQFSEVSQSAVLFHFPLTFCSLLQST